MYLWWVQTACIVISVKIFINAIIPHWKWKLENIFCQKFDGIFSWEMEGMWGFSTAVLLGKRGTKIMELFACNTIIIMPCITTGNKKSSNWREHL